ncbi:MAG: hypothetical protein GY861_25070 [bacterium]|nr:hypothetical protein [bacterium]
MKFERTDDYEAKLFECALFDEKNVIKDAEIVILRVGGKYKAYCENTDTYLQFPRGLRSHEGQKFTADVVEVIRTDNVSKYYRAMKKSIRNYNDNEVVG